MILIVCILVFPFGIFCSPRTPSERKTEFPVWYAFHEFSRWNIFHRAPPDGKMFPRIPPDVKIKRVNGRIKWQWKFGFRKCRWKCEWFREIFLRFSVFRFFILSLQLDIWGAIVCIWSEAHFPRQRDRGKTEKVNRTIKWHSESYSETHRGH